MKSILLQEYKMGDQLLANRIVMSSLTRGRVDNAAGAPTALNALYYAQRASAGLIITESTWVSERGIGFVNLPGIYNEAHVAGWKLVTDAVRAQGGKIFVQLAHSGSVSHPDFFNGDLPMAPSAINPQEKSFTPLGFKDTVTPRAFTVTEIKETVNEFKIAAQCAKDAGFDGIELHAQIFTLIPQFLSAATNQRTDEYGGSIVNRARFLFEVIDAVKTVWNSKCIGIKFTPAAFNPGIIKPDQETLATYAYILNALNEYDLAYVQLVSPIVPLEGTPLAALQDNFFAHFRSIYHGTLMANGGFTSASANEIIELGIADLVSFGAPFIANPDLVYRFGHDLPLGTADVSTYYSGGENGYTDYPVAQ